MPTSSQLKWRLFLLEIILLNGCWDCRYSLSSQNLEERMAKRGVDVDDSTINRGALQSAPVLEMSSA